jgi:DNA-binding LytR/AlgR family response regulator
MDIKMMLDPDDSMRRDLESLGIRDNQDSEYEIRRRDTGMRFLPGHRENQQFYVCVDDIFFIESMGHDVLIHTRDGIYNTSERLKSLEVILDPDKFLRVSNSTIVNLKQVKRIESSLMQKFILHMSNGARIDVTRSYYYIFRDRLGI